MTERMEELLSAAQGYAQCLSRLNNLKAKIEQLIEPYRQEIKKAKSEFGAERKRLNDVVKKHRQDLDKRARLVYAVGDFGDRNRLELPNIGYVDVTPQEPQAAIVDLPAFLTSPLGLAFVTSVEIDSKAAARIILKGHKIPGLVVEHPEPKVRVSIKDYEGE